VINAAFANKEVGGIICKSGGYGSTEVMEYLNDKAIQENPKLLCGYSDSTYLLLYIHDRLKMVVFHGPSLISGLAAMANMTKKYFVRVFAQNNYPLKIPMLSFQSWNSGKATGKVIGGNINKLLEYLDAYPDTSFKGKILFIEEFAETPARLGTLFYKLKKRGVFKGIKGILIGRFLDSNSKAMEEEDIKLAKNYLLHHLGDRNIPVLYGFMSGHGWEKVPLPFGTDVTIDATNRLVIYEECPFKEF
jgi:muramoyltetrapeptide carboxypeptidase